MIKLYLLLFLIFFINQLEAIYIHEVIHEHGKGTGGIHLTDRVATRGRLYSYKVHESKSGTSSFSSTSQGSGSEISKSTVISTSGGSVAVSISATQAHTNLSNLSHSKSSSVPIQSRVSVPTSSITVQSNQTTVQLNQSSEATKSILSKTTLMSASKKSINSKQSVKINTKPTITEPVHINTTKTISSKSHIEKPVVLKPSKKLVPSHLKKSVNTKLPIPPSILQKAKNITSSKTTIAYPKTSTVKAKLSTPIQNAHNITKIQTRKSKLNSRVHTASKVKSVFNSTHITEKSTSKHGIAISVPHKNISEPIITNKTSANITIPNKVLVKSKLEVPKHTASKIVGNKSSTISHAPSQKTTLIPSKQITPPTTNKTISRTITPNTNHIKPPEIKSKLSAPIHIVSKTVNAKQKTSKPITTPINTVPSKTHVIKSKISNPLHTASKIDITKVKPTTHLPPKSTPVKLSPSQIGPNNVITKPQIQKSKLSNPVHTISKIDDTKQIISKQITKENTPQQKNSKSVLLKHVNASIPVKIISTKTKTPNNGVENTTIPKLPVIKSKISMPSNTSTKRGDTKQMSPTQIDKKISTKHSVAKSVSPEKMTSTQIDKKMSPKHSAAKSVPREKTASTQIEKKILSKHSAAKSVSPKKMTSKQIDTKISSKHSATKSTSRGKITSTQLDKKISTKHSAAKSVPRENITSTEMDKKISLKHSATKSVLPEKITAPLTANLTSLNKTALPKSSITPKLALERKSAAKTSNLVKENVQKQPPILNINNKSFPKSSLNVTNRTQTKQVQEQPKEIKTVSVRETKSDQKQSPIYNKFSKTNRGSYPKQSKITENTNVRKSNNKYMQHKPIDNEPSKPSSKTVKNIGSMKELNKESKVTIVRSNGKIQVVTQTPTVLKSIPAKSHVINLTPANSKQKPDANKSIQQNIFSTKDREPSPKPSKVIQNTNVHKSNDDRLKSVTVKQDKIESMQHKSVQNKPSKPTSKILKPIESIKSISKINKKSKVNIVRSNLQKPIVPKPIPAKSHAVKLSTDKYEKTPAYLKPKANISLKKDTAITGKSSSFKEMNINEKPSSMSLKQKFITNSKHDTTKMATPYEENKSAQKKTTYNSNKIKGSNSKHSNPIKLPSNNPKPTTTKLSGKKQEAIAPKQISSKPVTPMPVEPKIHQSKPFNSKAPSTTTTKSFAGKPAPIHVETSAVGKKTFTPAIAA